MNTSVGEVSHFSKHSLGIEGNAHEFKFRIGFYNESIARVQISQFEEFRPNPYSVVLDPIESSAEVRESSDRIDLVSSKLSCEISKNPLRITFKDADGNVLNQDEPSFGTSWIGNEVTTYKKLHQDEIFLGLGEKTGDLNRRGSSYTNWNTDTFAYGPESDPLYISTPFYIGIVEGRAYGIFLDNTHKTHFNFGASSNDRFMFFSADDGDMDYYFIQGDSVADVIKHYGELTGKMELPPLWSLGYQQCRYSYYPDSEVKSIARTFRDKKIPADVIYLDIHYMDAYKAFTFDDESFPNPKEMIAELEDQGFKVVVILDPGIKTEEGYGPYDRGVEQDIFVKYPDGSKYEASVWPGNSHFPDFTSEKARDWWKEELKFYTDLGLKGFWNDMNEPACWGQDMPNLIEFEMEGRKATHKEARNVYGLGMVQSTVEGAKAQIGNQRPFTLTRSGFSGIQRYSAVWTGDNVACDEHMLLGVRLVNSLGLTGVPFAGYDVGGFAGEASPALFAKWIAVGAFAPFFRGHSMVNSRDAEPWAFGEEVEEISRNFINLRYRLLPYLYSAFYEATQTAMPVNRSLALAYYNDNTIYRKEYQNQFTCGDSILVAPAETNQKFSQVYLPKGEWYDFFTDQKHQGGQEKIVENTIYTLPVYVKGGAILPIQSQIQSTSEQAESTLELHVYHGETSNSFTYYEDDGDTYDYREGAYFKREVSFDPESNRIILGQAEGSISSKFNLARVYLHGFPKDLTFQVNGDNAEISTNDYRFFKPRTNFDPAVYVKPNGKVIPGLQSIEIEWDSNEASINW